MNELLAKRRIATESIDMRGPFQPPWPNLAELQAVCDRIAVLPPLVSPNDVDLLLSHMAKVAQGTATTLMQGDCANSFMYRDLADYHQAATRLMVEQSLIQQMSTGLPVVRIERQGSFAKPRTEQTSEVIGPDGEPIQEPNYFGDGVNTREPGPGRRPDPERLIEAYMQTALAYHTVGIFNSSGRLSLSTLGTWTKFFRPGSVFEARYARLVQDILTSLRMMRAAGIDLDHHPAVKLTQIFFAREVLLPAVEYGYVREDPNSGRLMHLGTHLPWVGARTNDPDGPQVELLSLIDNPCGVKISKDDSPEKVLKICDRIDPGNTDGRVTLIIRMGMRKNELVRFFPPILEAIKAVGRKVGLVSDPLHGNTYKTRGGLKTRDLDTVIEEGQEFTLICREFELDPGGHHLEVAAIPVNEVLGGPNRVVEEQLDESLVDPRLDPDQAGAYMMAQYNGYE